MKADRATLARTLESVLRQPTVKELTNHERVTVMFDAVVYKRIADVLSSFYRAAVDVPHHGIDTEIEAARKHGIQLKGLRRVVLAAFLAQHRRGIGHVGYTNSELIETHPHINPRSLQPRTAELVVLGLLKDSGQRRENRRGNHEIVYTLTTKGQHHDGETGLYPHDPWAQPAANDG